MTRDDFRRIALALSDVVESAHMGHPDFRHQNRIFASLHEKLLRGTVKLTPEQQAEYVAFHPDVFSPAAGAWGRQGWTTVDLARADEEILGEALTVARRNVTGAEKPRRSRRRS